MQRIDVLRILLHQVIRNYYLDIIICLFFVFLFILFSTLLRVCLTQSYILYFFSSIEVATNYQVQHIEEDTRYSGNMQYTRIYQSYHHQHTILLRKAVSNYFSSIIFLQYSIYLVLQLLLNISTSASGNAVCLIHRCISYLLTIAM